MIKIKMSSENRLAIIDVLSRMIKSLESEEFTNNGLCLMLPYYSNTYIYEKVIKQLFEERFERLEKYRCYVFGINKEFIEVEPEGGRYHFKNKLERIEFLQKLIKELEEK